jgi:hypothetical protein
LQTCAVAVLVNVVVVWLLPLTLTIVNCAPVASNVVVAVEIAAPDVRVGVQVPNRRASISTREPV